MTFEEIKVSCQLFWREKEQEGWQYGENVKGNTGQAELQWPRGSHGPRFPSWWENQAHSGPAQEESSEWGVFLVSYNPARG